MTSFDAQAPSKTVALPDAVIGPGRPVYNIAEIGGNFATAAEGKALIDAARGAGADAVKIQTYRAATVSSRKARFAAEGMEFTGDASQYEMFVKYQIDDAVQQDVYEYAVAQGVPIFSTPGHQSDVDQLEELGNAVYKIGSDDASNLPLLRYVARLGKPILLSTGMCTMEETRRAVDAVLGEGNAELVLLHCVTNYPAAPESVNLRAMVALRHEFGLPTGYSDHVLGNEVCLAAVALGACVIEKHFTLDKEADGPDHALSSTPDEFRALVDGVRAVEAALGDGIKRPAASEATTRRNNRKSVVALRDIKAGERVGADAIDIKRPGYGIESRHWEAVVGKVALCDIPAEEILTWEMLG